MYRKPLACAWRGGGQSGGLHYKAMRETGKTKPEDSN